MSRPNFTAAAGSFLREENLIPIIFRFQELILNANDGDDDDVLFANFAVHSFFDFCIFPPSKSAAKIVLPI